MNIEVFTFIKELRRFPNKKGDYSISLRLYQNNNKTFRNGSLYVTKNNTPYMNFLKTLNKGDLLDIKFNPSKNPRFPDNIDIKHIQKLKKT